MSHGYNKKKKTRIYILTSICTYMKMYFVYGMCKVNLYRFDNLTCDVAVVVVVFVCAPVKDIYPI